MAQEQLPGGFAGGRPPQPPVRQAVPPDRPAVPPDRQTRPDLQEALAVVAQRKWFIILVTLLAVGVAIFFSSQQVPIYRSQADVLVRSVDLDPGSSTASVPNLATESELAASVAVAEVASETLGTQETPTELLSGLSVDFPADTEILTLSYSHSVPEVAQERAQGFAEAYLEYRRRTLTQALTSSAKAIESEIQTLRNRREALEQQLSLVDEEDPRVSSLESELALVQGLLLQRQLDQLSLEESVNVGSIVRPAALPISPVSPNHVLNAAFALAAGLGLGIGLAFLRDRLAGRLRTVEEIEGVGGADVLARIPQIPTWSKRKKAMLVARHQWTSPAAEAYRGLRTNLLSLTSNQNIRSVLVTSPHTGEGKSATVANLGFVLARAGKSVILVSADLRRPRLHEFFDLNPSVGLTDVLLHRSPLSEGLFAVHASAGTAGMETIHVLPSGSVTEDPAELLSSARMNDLLRELESQADLVLVDAPPVMAVTDALVLAPMVSGVLIVLGPGSTTSAAISSSRQQLDKVAANVLGIVLNNQDPSTMSTYYSYS